MGGENEKNDWSKQLIIVMIAVFMIVLLLFIFGFGRTGGGMMGGGMMGFGWLFMLLPVILLILLVFALTDRNSTPEFEPPYYVTESAMQALERRYASGEISREEYLGIKEDIFGR